MYDGEINDGELEGREDICFQVFGVYSGEARDGKTVVRKIFIF